MESFGAELKRAREAEGIALRDMATRTKISIGTLEALEKSDFRRIPGGLFGRSFVRTYAVEVGLDADAIVERFVEELTEAERIEAERRRARQPAISLDDKQFLERQRRAFLFLRIGIVVAAITAILLVSILLRGWWFGQASAPADPAGPPAPEAGSAPLPAPGIMEPDRRDAPIAATTLVLDFEFTGESSMTVGLDGQAQPARLYRAGDTVRFEASTEVFVDAANAGVVRLAVNGRPARPLGAPGTPVRTRITSDNLSQFY